MTRDPWKLVLDEQELAPGMCVELRPCQWCGKKERLILLTEAGAEMAACADGKRRMANQTFTCTGKCNTCPGSKHGFNLAINDRRLYRLIDDDSAADETTTTRRKERVR